MTKLLLVGLLLGTAPVLAHDWYSNLQVPEGGSLCCGADDCAPYPHRATPGETSYELFHSRQVVARATG